MDVVLEFIKQNRMSILICAAIIFVLIFIIVLKKVAAKTVKKKELRRAAADKLRDENLNRVILNAYQEKEKQKEIHKPYDVDYGSRGTDDSKKNRRDERDAGDRLMIQLIEKTELSARKFVLNPAKIIRIGSDLQNNDIVVFSENVSPRQCEIFSAMDKVFIRNTGEKCKTVIKRKKEQAIVDNRGIRLLSGDVVILSNVSYDVTII